MAQNMVKFVCVTEKVWHFYLIFTFQYDQNDCFRIHILSFY